jgi:hypothetical protein
VDSQESQQPEDLSALQKAELAEQQRLIEQEAEGKKAALRLRAQRALERAQARSGRGGGGGGGREEEEEEEEEAAPKTASRKSKREEEDEEYEGGEKKRQQRPRIVGGAAAPIVAAAKNAKALLQPLQTSVRAKEVALATKIAGHAAADKSFKEMLAKDPVFARIFKELRNVFFVRRDAAGNVLMPLQPIPSKDAIDVLNKIMGGLQTWGHLKAATWAQEVATTDLANAQEAYQAALAAAPAEEEEAGGGGESQDSLGANLW